MADPKFGPYKWATTGRCEKHNTFYSVPDSRCEKCFKEFEETLSGVSSVKRENPEISLMERAIKSLYPEQSLRLNSGKTQLREVDPNFILGIGEVLTASRSKYPEGNWMKETKFSTPYESAMRHLMKYWNGDELDEETGKHHLLHAATNLMFLYYHQNSEVGIDDRLFKKEKK